MGNMRNHRALLPLAVIMAAVLLQGCSTIAGYNAKKVCSEVFVAQRPGQLVEDNDLLFGSLGKVEVDDSNKTAKASWLASNARTAIYRHGLGCTLLNRLDAKALNDKYAGLNKPTIPVISLEAAMSVNHQPYQCPTLSPVQITRLKKVVRDYFKPTTDCMPSSRAIAVFRKDRIVDEYYDTYSGFTAKTRLLGWSMTKSILSALFGIAVRKGLLTEEDLNLMPQWREDGDPRGRITIKQLLQMKSGLVFAEYYLLDDASNMLFRQSNMAAYAASQPLKNGGPKKWSYSSGTTNILSNILKQKLGGDQTAYYRFPYEELFGPLGMQSALLEPDESGTFVMSSYMYATARDWIRFGALYLNDGVWNDERLISSDWIKRSLTPGKDVQQGKYGYQWWLNRGQDEKGNRREWLAVPPDAYGARGHDGQLLAVIPSECLVVVRLGLTRQASCFKNAEFLERIYMAITNPVE